MSAAPSPDAPPEVRECWCTSGRSDFIASEGFLTCQGCGLVATGVQIFEDAPLEQRYDKEFVGFVDVATKSTEQWDAASALTPPARFHVGRRPIKVGVGASWLGIFRVAAHVCLEQVQILLGHKPDVSYEMITSAVAHVDKIYVQQIQEKLGTRQRQHPVAKAKARANEKPEVPRRRHSMANPVAAAIALVLHRWQIDIARGFPYARTRIALSLGALELPWASVVHAANDFVAEEERMWLLGFIARCRAAEGELGLRAGAAYFPWWQIPVPAFEFTAGGLLDSALARKLTTSESGHFSSSQTYTLPFSSILSTHAHPRRMASDFLDV